MEGIEVQSAKAGLSRAELIRRARDKVIDAIGMENIRFYFTCQERSGTLLTSITDANDKLLVVGATLGVDGLLGKAVELDGTNDYLYENPTTRQATGTTNYALDSGTKKLAEALPARLAGGRAHPHPVYGAFVEMNRFGTPTGTIIVSIQKAVSGTPDGTVLGTALYDAGVFQTAQNSWIGGSFGTLPTLAPGQAYWLVIEWSAGATVDGTRYVRVIYSTAGTNNGMQSNDGTTWSTVTTASINHMVLRTSWHIQGDQTWIALVKNPGTLSTNYLRLNYLDRSSPVGTGGAVIGLLINMAGGGGVGYFNSFTSGTIIATGGDYIGNAWHNIAAVTTGSVVALYQDGQFVGSAVGSATMNLAPAFLGQIGRRFTALETADGYLKAQISDIILVGTAISPTAIGDVAREFIGVRRLLRENI